MPFVNRLVVIAVDIVDRMRLAFHAPDLLLEVDLPNVGLFATDSSEDVIEAGRRTAMRRVKELAALKTKPLPPAQQGRPADSAQQLREAWAALHGTEDAP